MNWISTPSHAYLQVNKSEVLKSGFRPSTYSRVNNRFYYLEEDCDAPEYFKHIWGDDWKSKYIDAHLGGSFVDNHIDEII